MALTAPPKLQNFSHIVTSPPSMAIPSFKADLVENIDRHNQQVSDLEKNPEKLDTRPFSPNSLSFGGSWVKLIKNLTRAKVNQREKFWFNIKLAWERESRGELKNNNRNTNDLPGDAIADAFLVIGVRDEMGEVGMRGEFFKFEHVTKLDYERVYGRFWPEEVIRMYDSLHDLSPLLNLISEYGTHYASGYLNPVCINHFMNLWSHLKSYKDGLKDSHGVVQPQQYWIAHSLKDGREVKDADFQPELLFHVKRVRVQLNTLRWVLDLGESFEEMIIEEELDKKLV